MVASTTSGWAEDKRAAFLAGLRGLAAWLEARPHVPIKSYRDDRLLLPLSTNAAVEEVAASLVGEEDVPPVDYDDEGNASLSICFGPVTYYIYGYTDEHFHRRQQEEREKSGLPRHPTTTRPATGVTGDRPHPHPRRPVFGPSYLWRDHDDPRL